MVTMRIGMLCALILVCVALFTPPAFCGSTERVSVSSTGGQANAWARGGSISADGRYVAFYSEASNLVSEDTNGYSDIFVHDRLTGTTERVSVSSAGEQGDGTSPDHPVISGDGRFVAFRSEATNLVLGDSNRSYDIFVHDRATGNTERVSVSSAGEQGDGSSFHPSISGDGRYVAFYSRASNLVPGDTNGYNDVFVHDRLTGTTERVSVSSTADEGNWHSEFPSISADGRFVAFSSNASNLVPGDTNGYSDVFVRDRLTGTTERVSLSSAGEQANGTSRDPSISGDGWFVAFRSGATNLVSGDTNGADDVFVYDLFTGVTERVSISSTGGQGNGRSGPTLAICGDGRFVAFYSDASNLVPGDTNAAGDHFVHDRLTDTTERVNMSSAGEQGNSASQYPFVAVSADAQYVAFASEASNLVPGDSNGYSDIFVHDRHAPWLLPIADFSASPTSGTALLAVQFTDLSANAPTSWLWDFGDGGTSTEQDPTHVYDVSGVYTVSLTVSNIGGSDTETKTDYILVDAPPPPTAEFSGSPTSGMVPLRVRFIDLSTGDPMSWLWDFGDGETSGEQHPSHEYTSAGSYTVTLTASNAGGSDSETKVDYIAVHEPPPPPPVADFSGSPTSGDAPLTVSFTDLSTNSPTSWSWTFGDGSSSAAQNSSHEYTSAGTYTVSLTATNASGSDTETKVGYITVNFPDVPDHHWAHEEVLACVDAGIVSGYDDGNYHPDWTVTRDQMAVYIARAMAGGDENVPEFTNTPTFPDVDDMHWALDYVEYAFDQNVVAGYEDGNYHPEYEVTRDQMAVYIARALVAPGGDAGLEGYVPADPRNFPDVPSDFWAYRHVEYCVEHGVVNGYDDGLYHPEWVVTRDQMAVYVARAFQLPM